MAAMKVTPASQHVAMGRSFGMPALPHLPPVASQPNPEDGMSPAGYSLAHNKTGTRCFTSPDSPLAEILDVESTRFKNPDKHCGSRPQQNHQKAVANI